MRRWRPKKAEADRLEREHRESRKRHEYGLYCDEDSMRNALVLALRKRGVDILSALEAGTVKEPDDRQLAYAATQGRAIYSFNVGDFCRLHSQWLAEERSHAGIILAQQQQYSIGEQIRRLVKIIGTLSAEEMRNRLEFLGDRGETPAGAAVARRLRLPLRPKSQARMPFCTCMRLAACWTTTLCGPSITSSVTSSPRWAGRQCMKTAPFWRVRHQTRR